MKCIKCYNQIIVDLKEEKEEVFVDFVTEHFTLIYRYVNYHIKDVALSLDLSMEVFLRIYYKVLDYEYTNDFEFITWMFDIAKQTIDFAKKDDFSLKSKHAKIYSSSEEDYEISEKCRFTKKLKELSQMENLFGIITSTFSGATQFIVISRIYNNLSFRDIAEVLKCNESYVKETFEKSTQQLLNQHKVETSSKTKLVA